MSLDRFRTLRGHGALVAVALIYSGMAAAQVSATQSDAAGTQASAAPQEVAAAPGPNASPAAATPAPEAAPEDPAPAPPQSSGGTKNSDWHVVWHPLYLFASSVTGTAGAGGLTMPVDAGFAQIIDEVNFAYATAVDVRKNHWGVLLDLSYLNLGDSKTFPPLSPFSEAKLSSKMFFLDPEIYYRVKESDRGSFDAMVGFRYWHFSNKITFLPGVLPGTTVKADDNFADPIFGGRIRLNLDKDKKWYLPIKGDVGGFGAGSDLSWQIFGGVGHNFGKRSTVLLGWRALSLDRRNGLKILDVTFHGPVMSIGINLK